MVPKWVLAENKIFLGCFIGLMLYINSHFLIEVLIIFNIER